MAVHCLQQALAGVNYNLKGLKKVEPRESADEDVGAGQHTLGMKDHTWSNSSKCKLRAYKPQRSTHDNVRARRHRQAGLPPIQPVQMLGTQARAKIKAITYI